MHNFVIIHLLEGKSYLLAQLSFYCTSVPSFYETTATADQVPVGSLMPHVKISRRSNKALVFFPMGSINATTNYEYP